jgi:hypothetical protein
MRIEAQLNIFDGGLISRLSAVLSVKDLKVVPRAEYSSELLEDEDSKYKPFVSATSFYVPEDTILVVDHGKKHFAATKEEAQTIRNLRESTEFYFSYALQRVDASLFPEELVGAIALALGERMVADLSTPTPTTHASPSIPTPTTGLTMEGTPSWMVDSGDESDDWEPQVGFVDDADLDQLGALEVAFGELTVLGRVIAEHGGDKPLAEKPAAIVKPPAPKTVVVEAKAAPPAPATAFVDPAILSSASAPAAKDERSVTSFFKNAEVPPPAGGPSNAPAGAAKDERSVTSFFKNAEVPPPAGGPSNAPPGAAKDERSITSFFTKAEVPLPATATPAGNSSPSTQAYDEEDDEDDEIVLHRPE